MDWIIWVIVIVVIVGVVWWLLNRNSSGNTTGTSTSSDSGVSAPRPEQAGAGRPAGGTLAGGSAAASAEAAATTGMAGASGFASPSGPTQPITRGDSTDVVREAPAASAAETSTPAPWAAAAPAPATSGSAPAAASGGDVDDWDEDTTAATGTPAANTGTSAAGPGHAGTDSSDGPERVGTGAGDKPEWEAQWSEAASTPHVAAMPAGESTPAPASATQAPAAAAPPAPVAVGTQIDGAQAPIHHPEYTEPHAPTLPGAESAAAEDVQVTDARDESEAPSAAGEGPAAGVHPAALSDGDAETMQAAASSAATEAAASHMAEPSGHLAADKPYGEGSAAPGPDGSGPEGYTVKGNAQSMIYHDDTSPAYEETVAEVWFESAAHAEAAGFRAPRRSRH